MMDMQLVAAFHTKGHQIFQDPPLTVRHPDQDEDQLPFSTSSFWSVALCKNERSHSHSILCAVLLSEKRRSGLACRGNRILLPNWVGVFEGGGWPTINEKFELADNDGDGEGEKEDEDVSLNVIDDVQKMKNKKGAENRINFWRQVFLRKVIELSSNPEVVTKLNSC